MLGWCGDSRASRKGREALDHDLIIFPAHALLILEERLKEQEGEGVRMPEGMERGELALRILILAHLTAQGDA